MLYIHLPKRKDTGAPFRPKHTAVGLGCISTLLVDNIDHSHVLDGVMAIQAIAEDLPLEPREGEPSILISPNTRTDSPY